MNRIHLVSAFLGACLCAGLVPPSASAQVAATPSPESQPQAVASVRLPPALDRVLRDYERAWAARDAAALASLFAEDGFVLSGGRPPVRGRAAIERHYTGHGGPLSLRAFAFAEHGDVAYVLGGYAHAAGTEDDGKFTLTLRRGAGSRWVIFSDMDNGNNPPKR